MPKTPATEILDWASTQPAWRRDALRRILVKSFTKEDEEACYELLCAAHNVRPTKLTPELLDAKHLPVRVSDATSLRLILLDGIANVNRLASDASLAPAKIGLTLIYGDNGSGKSGFTRILKRACRARDIERILPDVFGKGFSGPATATFSVESDGKPQLPIIWEDNASFSSDLLARIAIFDSKCASVHVDGDNKLELIPHNLDCFEKFAQLCDRLRDRAKVEYDALEKQLAGIAIQPQQGTAAASFMATLGHKTDAELVEASRFSKEQEKRLVELGEMLKDPLSEATRLERIEATLLRFAESLFLALNALAAEKMQEIANLRTSAKALRAEADQSAEAAFASEPLPVGIGSDSWRALFYAAREHASVALPDHEFPDVGEHAHCVLCQQELDADAKDRFSRFAAFVTGAMNAKADAEEARRDTALKAVHPNTLIIPSLDPESVAYLEKEEVALAALQKTLQEALIQRRSRVLAGEAVNDLSDGEAVAKLRKTAERLGKSAVDARAIANSGINAVALKAEHAELSGRKLLHDNNDELRRRIGLHQDIAKLQNAARACGTKEISDHGSKLLKVYVTGELKNALTDEQKALGLTSIPLGLHDHTPKGAIHHRLKLNEATLGADTSSVLSEGEHRAVALAAFLSELKMYPGTDAIIIDDPVSSLDHVRRDNVAKRLVSEAKQRQVIIFTHDLVFLSEARFYAVQQTTPIQVLGIRRGPKGFGSRDPDGDPWATKSIPGRKQWLIEQLAKLKKLYLAASDDYEAQLRFFYDRLRESWERLIEERVFAQVITRFQPQVQTQRLREAVLDDDIFSQIYFGMSAVSNYTGHDRAAAKGGALAEPSECQQDFEAFTKCIEDIETLSKSVQKARDAKIKPRKTVNG